MLEGQTRPHFVHAAFTMAGMATTSRIVVFNCQAAVRKTRLDGRGQCAAANDLEERPNGKARLRSMLTMII